MKSHRLSTGLALGNLVLLLGGLTQLWPASGQTTAPVLRGRQLELVDERGRVRERLGTVATCR